MNRQRELAARRIAVALERHKSISERIWSEALRLALEAGLVTPLALAFLYDALLTYDAARVSAFVQRARQTARSVDEGDFMNAFLDARALGGGPPATDLERRLVDVQCGKLLRRTIF